MSLEKQQQKSSSHKFFSIKHGLQGLKRQFTFSGNTLYAFAFLAILALVFADVDLLGASILIAIAFYFISVVRRRDGYKEKYQQGYNAGLKDGNPDRYALHAELADDPMLPHAIYVTRKAGKPSASLLQQELHIGYARAARLIDELAEVGVVERDEGDRWKMVV